MAISIVEKVLNGANIYTNTYYNDTINLAKSIIVKNSIEALLYNDYIVSNYPKHTIDKVDKTTWRYYRHLMGLTHELDHPITLVSLDNGSTIPLTIDAIRIHRRTRSELLKFDKLYKSIVDKYPEQELYIKSVIVDNRYTDINEVIDLEDFSIVAYNYSLIEINEEDIVEELQDSINNYKVTRLIPYYNNSDDLFLVAQYSIFYTYLFTKLLSIRLANAKTLRAHSYHIYNYLSSHHNLDIYIKYLTKKQQLYLYRNLLYLNSHAGNNFVFNELIKNIFSERNIGVINYIYGQYNRVGKNYDVEYSFYQKLLNNKNLPFDFNNYSLEDIKRKEVKLLPGNDKEYSYHYKEIDQRFKYFRYNRRD